MRHTHTHTHTQTNTHTYTRTYIQIHTQPHAQTNSEGEDIEREISARFIGAQKQATDSAIKGQLQAKILVS